MNLYHQQSSIPYLLKNEQRANQASLFFKCYSDDIYEAILEDLRAHYIAISNQDIDDEDSQESYSQEAVPAAGAMKVN